jgi:hypothetical protein
LKNLFSLFIIILTLYIFHGCGNDDVKKEVVPLINSEFNWKDNLEIKDIPDFELRGYLNGKEVRFPYAVFEVWRGSNDNVLNFSLEKAEQNCGYIENYQGFQLISRGNPMKKGEYVKSGFGDDPKNYQSFFRYINTEGVSYKSDASWNCALNLENLTDKIASGKIAVCFDDENKSWIAGRFEASVCNN